VAWAVWAAWTIKPTLNPNDEGPDFFRAFYLVPQPRKKMHRLAEAKKSISDVGKKGAANYRFFFFAKIAFQLSL
jgi:hypothetical protein